LATTGQRARPPRFGECQGDLSLAEQRPSDHGLPYKTSGTINLVPSAACEQSANIAGDIDAALVTSPIKDERLHVEEIWSDRLVVCLRADHPLAEHSSLQADNLKGNLSILIDPQRHPAAHAVVLKYLEEADVHLDKYSRASHPLEMQTLVKEGFGFALICEGGAVDQELTTRPVAGTDWILGTSFVYRKQDYPKTIPALLRHLKSLLAAEAEPRHLPFVVNAAAKRHTTVKRQHHPQEQGPEQLSLLN
jgi:DNA-binding transcriptional LysR family regulator